MSQFILLVHHHDEYPEQLEIMVAIPGHDLDDLQTYLNSDSFRCSDSGLAWQKWDLDVLNRAPVMTGEIKRIEKYSYEYKVVIK